MRGQCVVTDNLEYCFFCGQPAHGVHHLLFGSDRNNADEDGIYIPICDACHLLGKHRIHDNPTAESLSKMLGQALWMLSKVQTKEQMELGKEKFRRRYGRSYL